MVEIDVIIPVHPGRMRNGLLDRAIKSVWEQTLPPARLIIAVDSAGEGAAVTRQKALDAATADWVAFLDSDDEFLPDHLATLAAVVEADEDVIMAYSWFNPIGMPDPLGHFGLPFNPATPHHTTMTMMVQRIVAQEVGFPQGQEGSTEQCLNEDWIFLLGLCKAAVQYNLKMIHVPKRTWNYHGHSGNTSGRPRRGDG